MSTLDPPATPSTSFQSPSLLQTSPIPSYAAQPELSAAAQYAQQVLENATEPTWFDDKFIYNPRSGPILLNRLTDPLIFLNRNLLSHLCAQFKDKIKPTLNKKAGRSFPMSFTGKSAVNVLCTIMAPSIPARHDSIPVLRAMQSQLFIHEVEWESVPISDDDFDLFSIWPNSAGLPTGVITRLTGCYSPTCSNWAGCYSYSCPCKDVGVPSVSENGPSRRFEINTREWSEMVDQELILSLSGTEIARQTVIHNQMREEYNCIQALNQIDSLFIFPLRHSNPSILPDTRAFLKTVFNSVVAFRTCISTLFEALRIRRREDGPVIHKIADIYLEAFVNWTEMWPDYFSDVDWVIQHVNTEITLNEGLDAFMSQVQNDFERLMRLPALHFEKYSQFLQDILVNTEPESPDLELVGTSERALSRLITKAGLVKWQRSDIYSTAASALGWHDLVLADTLKDVSQMEQKRQATMFELIKGEMEYVADLNVVQDLFLHDLQISEGVFDNVAEMSRFIEDVFGNIDQLLILHRALLSNLHALQREEHPLVSSLVVPLTDICMNWNPAYEEYIPHFPIALSLLNLELENKPGLYSLFLKWIRDPRCHKLDLKAFISRPLPRLQRYPLLLRDISKRSVEGSEDIQEIGHVIGYIDDLLRATQSGVDTANQKVLFERLRREVTFKSGEFIDLVWSAPERRLVLDGRAKLLVDANISLDKAGSSGSFADIHLILLDNYLLITKVKDRVTRAGPSEIRQVIRRPIPLDLLKIKDFSLPVYQKPSFGGRLGMGLSHDVDSSRSWYPFNIQHLAKESGVTYTFIVDSAESRAQWEAGFQEALGTWMAYRDGSKNFFSVPLTHSFPSEHTIDPLSSARCSLIFKASQNRTMFAIGRADGLYIGNHGDVASWQKVLAVKQITQIAVLEKYGIFVVLADRMLTAWRIDDFVPPTDRPINFTRQSERLSSKPNVSFFSVGELAENTLLIFARAEKSLSGVGSMTALTVMEPLMVQERPNTLRRNLFGGSGPGMFKKFCKTTFVPSRVTGLKFLQRNICILCSNSIEIIDPINISNKPYSLPATANRNDDSGHIALYRRVESSEPIGIFKLPYGGGFLLSYTTFGFFIDRHGTPVPGWLNSPEKPGKREIRVTEWEGTPKSAAVHEPYLFLFDTTFVEVRELASLRLAQIIPGQNIACTWDGTGVVRDNASFWSDQMAKVHYIADTEDISPREQQIQELYPTEAIDFSARQSPSPSSFYAFGTSRSSAYSIDSLGQRSSIGAMSRLTEM